MFGFKGVGGDPIVVDPDPRKTPEPATILGLLGVGVLSLGLKKSVKA